MNKIFEKYPIRIVELVLKTEDADHLMNKEIEYLAENYGVIGFHKKEDVKEDYIKMEIGFPIFEKYEVTRQKVREIMEEFGIEDPGEEMPMKIRTAYLDDFPNMIDYILNHQ